MVYKTVTECVHVYTFTLFYVLYNHSQGNCIICLQNCFDLPLEKNVLVVKKKHLKFEAVGQKSRKKLRSLE